MSATEELEEHIHHAQNPFDKTVAGSMAIMAALLAVVSVSAQHFNTEQLLLQDKASDQWAYSEAKDIRHYVAVTTGDIMGNLRPGSPAVKVYQEDAKKYKNQTAEIQEKAKDYEKERDSNGEKAGRFHFSEVFLEVAIVFSSVSILMKVKALFAGGVAAALIGIGIAATWWWA
jgi:uncharacterized protein DUF4337